VANDLEKSVDRGFNLINGFSLRACLLGALIDFHQLGFSGMHSFFDCLEVFEDLQVLFAQPFYFCLLLFLTVLQSRYDQFLIKNLSFKPV